MSELDYRGADFRPDTGAARGAPATRRSPGLFHYIGTHWLGTQTLARSFWINTVTIGGVLLLLEIGTLAWIRQSPPASALIVLFLLTYGALRLAIAIWQIVGTMRAAALLENRWSAVLNVLMFACILISLGRIALYGWEVQTLSSNALAQLMLTGGKVDLSADGHAVVATGPMGLGYTGAIARAFAQHPDVHQLKLDGNEGVVVSAVKLRDFLAAHPDISVEVDKQCGAVCLIAFTGAAHRIVGPHGVLSFSSLSPINDLGLVSHFIEQTQLDFKRRVRQGGASPFFMHDAFAATSQRPYQPDTTDLFTNGVITGVHLESGVMNADGWHVEQFLIALRENPKMHSVLRAIELIRARYPKIFDTWLKTNLAARYEPNLDVREQKAERAFLHALGEAGKDALVTAPDAAVERMAVARDEEVLLVSQLKSPHDCGKYVGGEPTDLGAMQFGLFIKGVDRMTAIIGDGNPGHPAPYDSAVGAARLAQARKEVAVAVPRQRGADPYDTACVRESRLLEQLTAKPTSGDAMALRLMFLGVSDRTEREAFLFSP